MTILDWQRRIHALARSKGWWDKYPLEGIGFRLTTDEVLSKLALIHSEVSEALEDVRVGKMKTTGGGTVKPEGFPSELADVVIRCFDLAGAMGIDLEEEIRIKHSYNETRAVRHGGKLA